MKMIMRSGLIFFLLFVAYTVCLKDEIDELDLTVFNDTTVSRFESQVKRLRLFSDYQRFISRLGKIAFFTRLTRRFAKSPNVGSINFEHYFPKPELPFHSKLYMNCRANIKKCVDFIFDNIQSRSHFLFPVRGQFMDDFEISAEKYNRLFPKNMLQFDVSVSYLFCYLTKNKFEPLRQLPYCKYADFNSTKKKWPSERYKEYNEHSELIYTSMLKIEAIDEMSSFPAFQCAEQSFCPDPCCGFGHGSSNAKCSHSICQNASKEMTCSIKNHLNSDILGMVSNTWNITCDCDSPGRVYRFDVRRCVISDKCSRIELNEKGEVQEHCSAVRREVCINTLDSFECICQFGYIKNPVTGACMPFKFGPIEYNGLGINYTSDL